MMTLLCELHLPASCLVRSFHFINLVVVFLGHLPEAFIIKSLLSVIVKRLLEKEISFDHHLYALWQLENCPAPWRYLVLGSAIACCY